MSDVAVDFAGLSQEQIQAVADELKQGHMQSMVDAEVRQRQLAKENHRDHRSINGVGRLVARFDLDGYMSNFVRKGESVQDKNYLDWVIKRHPEVKVISKGTKTQVGYGSCS